jgi:5,6-dimethylbenzimidazole synthase|tara:strand:+ start:272 stop:922 length:651 start_codon:yes stop_codon:yes gene_type:complete
LNTIISQQERDDFYKVLYGRRDVRSEFLPDPVADDVLERILQAAHHAPSVGFSQPWNFIVLHDQLIKQSIHDLHQQANADAAEMFTDKRQNDYRQIKLAGILDAPINICITCDRERGGSVVLGKTHQPEMDIYSTVCAVQNLQLAARAENIGVGWVSIMDKQKLKTLLKIPKRIEVVAYLCIGHVSHFYDEPELQVNGWQSRADLVDLVANNQWDF